MSGWQDARFVLQDCPRRALPCWFFSFLVHSYCSNPMFLTGVTRVQVHVPLPPDLGPRRGGPQTIGRPLLRSHPRELPFMTTLCTMTSNSSSNSDSQVPGRGCRLRWFQHRTLRAFLLRACQISAHHQRGAVPGLAEEGAPVAGLAAGDTQIGIVRVRQTSGNE